MSGLLSLKWNNHSVSFLKTVSKIRKKELYSDATIICNGRYYQVHRFVLSTCSEYFEEIFEKIDCKNPIIIIKDIDAKELESLLNYMYEGEVNVLQELLPALIKAAEALKIRGLAVPDDEDKNELRNSSGNSRSKRHRISSPLPVNKRSRGGRSTEVSPGSNDAKKSFTEDNSDKDELNVIKNLDCPEQTSGSGEDSNQRLQVLASDENQNSSQCEYNNMQHSQFTEPQVKEFKLEPADVEASHHEYDSGEVPFSENVNFKDEKYMDNQNDDSASSQQEIPQCSTWDDIITSPDGDGLSSLEGRPDEIDAQIAKPRDANVHVSFLKSKVSSELQTFLRLKHKRYVCHLCSYTSDKASNFKCHLLVHSGDKPFPCYLCSYSATTKQNMIQHIKSKHIREKPLRCNFCNYGCFRQQHLEQHMMAHHHNKRFC